MKVSAPSKDPPGLGAMLIVIFATAALGCLAILGIVKYAAEEEGHRALREPSAVRTARGANVPIAR